jgi:hypothetical protein
MENSKHDLEQKLAKMQELLAQKDADLDAAHNELANAHAEIGNLQNSLDQMHGDNDLLHSLRVDDATLTLTLTELEVIRNSVLTWLESVELSQSERRRLQGAGTRRYGFIDKISDVIPVNPQFLPSNVSEPEYKELIRKFEVIRNITIVLRQILRVVSDMQLIMGDEAYRLALSYYGAVRDAARRRVPGAQELFNVLRTFFVTMRRTREEPTEMEVERAVRGLERGTRTGKIVIENEEDKIVKGRHIVIDDTHKPEKASFRVSEEGEIEE